MNYYRYQLNKSYNQFLSFINKEKDFESSLGDFGVRKYEDGLGRFTTCDPLFEKYYGWSPYVYSANNPVNLYDNNGKWWQCHHNSMTISALGRIMTLSGNQISQIRKANDYIDKERNDPVDQFLHCNLSPQDIENSGGSTVFATLSGMQKLKNEYDKLKSDFLASDGDEEVYFLTLILHSIQEKYVFEHNWKEYNGSNLYAILKHQREVFDGVFGSKDYYDAINASYEEALKLFKEKSEYRKRNAIGTEIGNSAGFWFLGTPFYNGK